MRNREHCSHRTANIHGCQSKMKYFSNFIKASEEVQPEIWTQAHVCSASNPICLFFPAGCWPSEFSRQMANSLRYTCKALCLTSEVFRFPSSQLLIFSEKSVSRFFFLAKVFGFQDIFSYSIYSFKRFLFLFFFNKKGKKKQNEDLGSDRKKEN